MWLKPLAGRPWTVSDPDTPPIVTSLALYTMCRQASDKAHSAQSISG